MGMSNLRTKPCAPNMFAKAQKLEPRFELAEEWEAEVLGLDDVSEAATSATLDPVLDAWTVESNDNEGEFVDNVLDDAKDAKVVAELADAEGEAETTAIAVLESEKSEARNASVLSSEALHVLIEEEVSRKLI